MTERDFDTSGDWLVFRRHCIEAVSEAPAGEE